MEKKEINLEENRFHKARFEIGKIDEPVDIAAEIYAREQGWDWTQGGEAEAEYEAFMEHYHTLQRMTSKYHNYVAEYFGV